MIFVFIFYVSVILSTIAVIRGLFTFSWKPMLIGILLSLPYVLYLSATPRFSWFFIYPIILLLITTLLFFRDRKRKNQQVS